MNNRYLQRLLATCELEKHKLQTEYDALADKMKTVTVSDQLLQKVNGSPLDRDIQWIDEFIAEDKTATSLKQRIQHQQMELHYYRDLVEQCRVKTHSMLEQLNAPAAL